MTESNGFHTNSLMKTSYSVRDLYEISRGHREEWGIENYQVPKTLQYVKHTYHFPKEKRSDTYSLALKRQDWPSPASHSPELKQDFKRHWLSKGGIIGKGKKMTIIDQIMKNEKAKPGPCDYFKDPPQKVSTSPNQGKGERMSFLSTVEAHGEEVPCSWKYDPYAQRLNKHPVSMWQKPKNVEKKPKDPLGPGCYEKYTIAKNSTLPNSMKFSIPKANALTAGHVKSGSAATMKLPGVGQYSEAYFGSSLAELIKKKNKSGKVAVSKSKRYLDDIIKTARNVPGPGAYYIGPPIESKKL